MNCKTFLRSAALSALVLVLAACGGGGAVDSGSPSDSGTGNPVPADSPGSGGLPGPSSGTELHAGIGASNAQPTGRPYVWSQEVQVEQPIKGDDPFCIPSNQPATPRIGRGGLVRVCLGFRNTRAVPVTVTLPPGLIFVSNELQSQNGLVLTNTPIVVPPSATTWYAPVYLYCLNLGRLPTTGGQNTYKTGPLTDDTSLLELLALLKDKQVPLSFEFKLQQILWDITDGTGLTQDDRNALAAL